MEPDLVFPLLRGVDVARWRASSELSILVTHEEGMRLKAIPEAAMQENYPKTWNYLVKHKEVLKKTGLFKRFCKPTDPFYSMFDIGDYTFAPWKVVIREIAGELTCAVAPPIGEKPIIPDHKLVVVATAGADEAHYLCGALNSGLSRLFVGSYCIETQFSSHIFKLLAIPKYKRSDKIHQRLVQLSEQGHELASSDEEHSPTAIQQVEEEIDRWAAKLWGLSDDELAEVRRSLEEA